MRVSIETITFDLQGAVDLDVLPSSGFSALSRRTNKVATLDGGVAINDFGFTDADRDFTLRIKPTPEQDAALRYIVANYAQVHVSAKEGLFTAIPEYAPGPAESSLNLSITARVA